MLSGSSLLHGLNNTRKFLQSFIFVIRAHIFEIRIELSASHVFHQNPILIFRSACSAIDGGDNLSRGEGFRGEGHCRNLILFSSLIVESGGSIAEAHDDMLSRIGDRNGTGLGSWRVKHFSTLGRGATRTRKFQAGDEIVVGGNALQIIFDWINGNGTQSILLSNCSPNEVESLLEVGVFH